MNTTLYLTPDNARYFLVPDDLDLPLGDFEVQPVGGKARRNRASALFRAMLSLSEKRMARR